MALPQQLKVSPGRLATTDLGNTIPTQLGNLESALCDIFGFTANTDITASPLSCDNSGNLTKALIFQKAAGPVGWRFKNTTSGQDCRLVVNGTVLQIDANTGSEGSPVWATRFSIDMANGNLSGNTFSSSNPGLAPATSAASDHFLNATGGYTVPVATATAAVRVVNSTNQSILASTPTALNFDTVTYDDGGFHSGGAPSKLTFPFDGKYFVTCGVVFDPGTAATLRQCEIRLNGSAVAAGNGVQESAATASISVGCSTYVNVVAGDYVQCYAYHTSSGAINAVASSYAPQFEAFKIG